MLRMDQVHVIRHKVLREGASIRQAARALGLAAAGPSRNTVSKYLDQSAPARRTYRRRGLGAGVSSSRGWSDHDSPIPAKPPAGRSLCTVAERERGKGRQIITGGTATNVQATVP